MINAMPWPEHCVLAPVYPTPCTLDAVVDEYRDWARKPGNAIEVDGIDHRIGPMFVHGPLKAERYGRWFVTALWWPEMRRTES